MYYDPGPPPEYAIGEAKYGASTLSTLSDGTPQMSDKWINGISNRGMTRLEDAVGNDMADEISAEGYTRLLIHVDPDGTVTESTLDSVGKVIK